jgi:hypothetical protein
MIREFFPSNLDFISANAVGYFSSMFLFLFVAASAIAGYHLFRGERKVRSMVLIKPRRKETVRVIRRPRHGQR